MDLVKTFKDRIKKYEETEGLKYDILYEGYETALKNNRLLCYWHPIGTELVRITSGDKSLIFKISGNLIGSAIDEDGNGKEIKKFEGVVEPSVHCATDNELSEIMLDPKEGVLYQFDDISDIVVTMGDKEKTLSEKSIAKAIFDIKTINSLFAEMDTAAEKPKAKKKESKKESPIKDSGNRTEFKSGTVRDIQAGKGRCDLLPLDIVGEYFACTPDKTGFEEISLFQEDHDRSHLIKAAKSFATEIFPDDETAILEYACHLEDGCNKYGDRNWEKGIPLSRFVDSGIRHLLKYRRGDDDERHDRAFIWNMLCGAWTCKHHPDLVSE